MEFLLYQRIFHYQFQSVDKIKEDIKDVSDILIEGLELEKTKFHDRKDKLKVTRLIAKLRSLVRFSEYKKTRTTLTAYVYDFILSLDGLGTLPGFGFGNKFGDKIQGNSERVSLRNIRTLLKE